MKESKGIPGLAAGDIVLVSSFGARSPRTGRVTRVHRAYPKAIVTFGRDGGREEAIFGTDEGTSWRRSGPVDDRAAKREALSLAAAKARRKLNLFLERARAARARADARAKALGEELAKAEAELCAFDRSTATAPALP